MTLNIKRRWHLPLLVRLEDDILLNFSDYFKVSIMKRKKEKKNDFNISSLESNIGFEEHFSNIRKRMDATVHSMFAIQQH